MKIVDQCKDAVAAASSVIPGAICAGGVARDVLRNRPVKDIDIFVPYLRQGLSQVDEFDHDLLDIRDKLKGFVSNLPSSFAAETDHEVHGQGVIEFDDGRLPVNIIALNMDFDVDVLFNRFDIDLCEAYLNMATGEFHASGKASRAFYNKIMTIRPRKTQQDADRSYARYERLLHKYVGFALKNESGFPLQEALSN